MTIDELNAKDRSGFLAAVGWVFEGSPWVAERAWPRRPFANVDALHQSMVEAVMSATPDEQLALLRAHPDLGARMRMSPASNAEQHAARLDALDAGDLLQLRTLNAAYREKFGFPFIYAVKGSTKQDILKALDERLMQTREIEAGEALRQVSRIARFRLDDVVGQP
jgi:2-oxo-4-hydroxy-4-carboxy-5-ureidoimidazoline decarboxylase